MPKPPLVVTFTSLSIEVIAPVLLTIVMPLPLFPATIVSVTLKKIPPDELVLAMMPLKLLLMKLFAIVMPMRLLSASCALVEGHHENRAWQFADGVTRHVTKPESVKRSVMVRSQHNQIRF